MNDNLTVQEAYLLLWLVKVMKAVANILERNDKEAHRLPN